MQKQHMIIEDTQCPDSDLKHILCTLVKSNILKDVEGDYIDPGKNMH